MTTPITIYTDGACLSNPGGRGGVGIILMYNDRVKKLAQGYMSTTNNRMELRAVITALELLKTYQLPVHIYSDSQYVVRSIEEGWIEKWKSKDFHNTKNPDLWQKLIDLLEKIKNVKFIWVKGHADNLCNNECDRMANAAAKAPLHTLIQDEGYEM